MGEDLVGRPNAKWGRIQRFYPIGLAGLGPDLH